MSYKIALDGLERDSAISLTEQIVSRFRSAIDGGRPRPGREAPDDARAGRGGRRQPPDRRARLPAPGRGGLCHGNRRARHVRPPRAARPPRPRRTAPTGRPRCCPRSEPPTPTRSWPTPSVCPPIPDIISLAVGWPDPRAVPDRRPGPDHSRGVPGARRRGDQLRRPGGVVDAAGGAGRARACRGLRRVRRGDPGHDRRAPGARPRVARAIVAPPTSSRSRRRPLWAR